MHTSNIVPGPDTVRILITTDNHVGYNENDSIRSDDSWKTFQEITYLAKEKDVDMILQSGDLFHINKPSKKSMYHVMRSLRLNCMGDRPCELELLSDPAQTLGGDGFNTVNYEDPNLNISVPVFAISGNHDDATGEGLLSPIDLLSVAGLVNHFGKVPNNDNIIVSPLLFQKGTTKLSLYGLANVRDERLFRTFRDGKVKFQRPSIYKDDWFNLMAVHQNHSAHTDTSYLPEQFLPNFLDLVVWGHEHECIPYPIHNSNQQFDVLQPGSSIATSLCEGEAKEKCVFILNVKGTNYSLETIPLKTVRPFEMDEISLKQQGIPPGPASKHDIEVMLNEKVEDLIKLAEKNYKETNSDLYEDGESPPTPLPLIRLRVDYSGGYEVGNARRFSNKFVGRVANVNDVIQFYKKREKSTNVKTTYNFTEPENLEKSDGANIKVQQLMNEFLAETELNLLPEEGINNAVATYLNQEDKQVLKRYIDKELEQETNMLMRFNIDIDHDEITSVKNVIKNLKKQKSRSSASNKSRNISQDRKIVQPKKSNKSKEIVSSDNSLSDDSELNEVIETRKPRQKSNVAVPKNVYSLDENDDDEEHHDDNEKASHLHRKESELIASEDEQVMIISDSETESRKTKNRAKAVDKRPTRKVVAREASKKKVNKKSNQNNILDDLMSI